MNGGAFALGHPIGVFGAKTLITLIYEMKRRGCRTGLAGLCLGGSGAVVLSIEV